jgi:hypothetical protein
MSTRPNPPIAAVEVRASIPTRCGEMPSSWLTLIEDALHCGAQAHQQITWRRERLIARDGSSVHIAQYRVCESAAKVHRQAILLHYLSSVVCKRGLRLDDGAIL